MTAAKTNTKKKGKMYWINAVVVLFLMFGFKYIPPIGGLSELGMNGVGIFISLIYAWTFVDFVWPSLLGIVAVALTDFTTMNNAFMTAFGDSTVLLTFFVLTYVEYLTRTGLCKYVAYWFVSREMCIGRPYVLMAMLFAGSFVIGAMTGSMASLVIGWAIVYELADIADFEKGDKYLVLSMIGIVAAGALGVAIFPFKAIAAIFIAPALQIAGYNMEFTTFFGSSIIVSLISCTLIVLASKFIFRPNTRNLLAQGDLFKQHRDVKMTAEQKIGAVSLIFVICACIAPDVLPDGWAITAFCKRFSLGTIVAVVLAILGLVRVKGKKLCDVADCVKNGVNWEMIIMLAGSMPIAALLKSEESGVTILLNNALTAVLGDFSPFVIGIIFILFAGIITQVAHNIVLAIVLAPVIANLAVSMNFNPLPIVVFASMLTNFGIATPGASILGAMIYSNREWLPLKPSFITCWALVFIVIIVAIVVGYPIVSLMC